MSFPHRHVGNSVQPGTNKRSNADISHPILPREIVSHIPNAQSLTVLAARTRPTPHKSSTESDVSLVAQIIFRRRLLNVVTALIVAFAGVSFAYWYYSNIKANGWYWHFEFVFPTEPGRPTKGGDQKPAEPPKSLEPWVTQDEINLQKTLGRNLLIFSPEELLRRWLNNRDINIYLNNWIKINYAASSTPLPQTIDKKARSCRSSS
jgi:hypothetical protein